jgi:hypothetical protein
MFHGGALQRRHCPCIGQSHRSIVVKSAGDLFEQDSRSITETLEAVDRFAPDFVEGMADDNRAGPAKQLARELLAAGIDLTDQSAVQRRIDDRNEGLPRGATC